MPSTITDRLNGLTTSVAVKPPCVAVSSTNVTLAGLQTIGGVVLVDDDRVLLIGQTDTTENGIYTADSGDWTRAADFDGPRDAVAGTLVLVRNQFTEGAFYEVTSTNPISFGTDSITFRLRDAPNVTYDLTQPEIDEGVTIIVDGRKPGDFARYGFSASASAAVNVTAANAAMASNSLAFCDDPGTYLIDGNLLAQSNQTVRIAQGVTIQLASTVTALRAFFINEVENFELQGGVFDGNKAANPDGVSSGVVMFNSSNVRLIGVTAQNFPSDNTTLGTSGDGFYIGGFAGSSPGCTDIELISCRATGNVRQGLSIVRVDGCAVIGGKYSDTTGNNPGGGIDVEANPGLGTASNIRIIGVEMADNYSSLILTEASFNVTVTGCQMLRSRCTTLLLSNVTNATIVGNYLEPAQTVDGPIADFPDSDAVVFASNVIQGEGAASAHEGAGVRFAIGSTNISIIGNTFKTVRQNALSLGNSALSGVPTNINFSDNTMIDCVDAVSFTTAGVIGVGGNTGTSKFPLLVTIRNNIIRDTRGTPAAFGVKLVNIPDATSAEYRIDGNRVSGPTTPFNNNIKDVPPLCGVVTWNPGNLVDGAGETSPDITVTGAAIGDSVEVYAPYAVGDCVLSGSVKSSNTCVIRLQNESGAAAFDGASGSWRVRVRKLFQA